MGFFLSLSAPSKENVWSKLKIVPVKIVKIFFFLNTFKQKIRKNLRKIKNGDFHS